MNRTWKIAKKGIKGRNWRNKSLSAFWIIESLAICRKRKEERYNFLFVGVGETIGRRFNRETIFIVVVGVGSFVIIYLYFLA